MATAHSYGATVKNNATESEAFLYLASNNIRFKRPIKEERKEILQKLNLPASFSRTFDLVYMPEGNDFSVISEIPVDKLILVELKTTKKKLTALPDGFFFGATDNEFQLAKRLGNQYVFCFVSIHSDSPGYAMLSLEALEKKIKTKRVQYQINL